MRLLLLFLLVLLSSPGFAAPAEIVDKPFRQASRSGQYVVHGRYPQVRGLANAAVQASVNKLLRQGFFTNPDRLEAEDRELYADNPYDEEREYEVTFNQDDLLSVQVTGLGMMERAAHPSHLFRGVTVDLKTGRPVSWSDLFASSAAVDPLIVRALRRNPDLPDVLVIDPAAKRDFVFTPEGLRIMNLMGGAAASVTVTLPWDEVRPLLKDRRIM